MRTAAVIAECNPFHEGHAYLINKLKEEAGADRVLLLLSGDFVQRGVPAVTDKYVRTKMALTGGADLVFTYPVRFATSAAPDFAEAAVRILDGLGCVDVLGFGIQETGLEELEQAADILEKCTPEGAGSRKDGRDDVGEAVRSGMSYPAAVAAADPVLTQVLSGTGNVLALEYIKALRKTGSRMKPFAVQRTVTSASSLREMLGSAPASYDQGSEIPAAARDVLLKDLENNPIVSPEDLSILLYDRLIREESAEGLIPYLGVTESLAHALFEERFKAVSFTALAAKLHTKDRTAAAVQRALLHTALGIKKKPIGDDMLFAQILGFREEAAPLLTKVSGHSRIPVLAKAAQAKKKLQGAAYDVFLEEIRACELYSGLRAVKSGRIPESEYTRRIMKVP